MKKYIATVESKAMPMTLGEYYKYRGQKRPKGQDPNAPGYLVEDMNGQEPNDERHDGYITWCPKDRFEKINKIADTPLDRMRFDSLELSKKTFGPSLDDLLSEGFKELDRIDKVMLMVQGKTMFDYQQILEQRIRKMTTGHRDVCSLDFGQALEYLKDGEAISRAGWNGKGMFVFQRPEDSLPIDMIVNKVKSLPQSFKDWVEKNYDQKEDAHITFTSYLCLKSADGKVVNGWTPSQSDLFAEDWYVVE